ncbi:MAG: sigma-70 family RNA polymerase sigma factor [Lachnospiraceae bacterium]|nr:sigma-70 family RNA polymerase sigma factor [Lachnospiraceae bacterium]
MCESIDTNPEISMEYQDRKRLISEILDELPPEQRVVLSMFFMQEMSTKEIAETLGVSESTVKSRKAYGKKKVEASVKTLEKKGVNLWGLTAVGFFAWLLKGIDVDAAELPAETVLLFIRREIFNTSASGASADTMGSQMAKTAEKTTASQTGKTAAKEIGKTAVKKVGKTVVKEVGKAAATVIGKTTTTKLLIGVVTVAVAGTGVGEIAQNIGNSRTAVVSESAEVTAEMETEEAVEKQTAYKETELVETEMELQSESEMETESETETGLEIESGTETDAVEGTSSDNSGERPGYTASDYMSVGNYIGVTVTDIEVDEVSDYDIVSWINARAEDQGLDWEISNLYELTYDMVSSASGGNSYTVDTYIEHIGSFIQERRELYRIKNLFVDIWQAVSDTYVFEGFPEDTYKYDTETVDIVAEYGARFGLSKEKMEEVLEDHPDTMDLIIEKVENHLQEEMILHYIADEQNISYDMVSDEEKRQIAVMYGYESYEELQKHYDQDDIDYYSLYLRVAQYVVSKANIVVANE